MSTFYPLGWIGRGARRRTAKMAVTRINRKLRGKRATQDAIQCTIDDSRLLAGFRPLPYSPSRRQLIRKLEERIVDEFCNQEQRAEVEASTVHDENQNLVAIRVTATLKGEPVTEWQPPPRHRPHRG